MHRGFIEEGDLCPECKDSRIDWEEHPGCSCHINPPCSGCTDRRLVCSACDWRDEAPECTCKAAGGGISEMVYRPKPLDNTKVDWRYEPHTHFSMKKKGVYPEGMEKEAVEREVRGTFGGRFLSFGGGKFSYIAYTD